MPNSFDLSKVQNKQGSLRFDLYKFWNKQVRFASISKTKPRSKLNHIAYLSIYKCLLSTHLRNEIHIHLLCENCLSFLCLSCLSPIFEFAAFQFVMIINVQYSGTDSVGSVRF